MQQRPVDMLRRPLMDAIRADPSNDKLPLVENLVTVLESRSRSAASARKLFPEADAVLALDINDVLGPGSDFWRTLLIVVAFTEGKDWFKRFFEWHKRLEIKKEEENRWSNVQMYVASYHQDDELSPLDAAQNITDWTKFARMLLELKKPPPPPKVLAAIDDTYVTTLHGLLMHVQVLLDRAIAEVASAKPPHVLRQVVKLIEIMDDLPDAGLWDTRIDTLNKPEFFIDCFPLFGRRRFKPLHYERDSDAAFVERETTFQSALTRRKMQAGQLAEFYGHPRKDGDAPSEADKLRQRTMQGIRKPVSIDIHEQFVRLLEGVFVEQHDEAKRLGKKSLDALLAGWDATVNMIEDLLDRFTAHSAYDLTDDGPDYLITPFPRALAGERLHDCGVYAVHIASWLLHLEQALQLRHRHKLGLDVRFVNLPVHLGLIVRVHLPGHPADPSGLPIGGALIAHNAQLHRMILSDVRQALTAWDTLADDPDPDPSDPELKRRKLFEDIAASHYISGVDMPVSSKRVLAPSVSVTTKAVFKSFFDFTRPAQDIFSKAVLRGPGDLFQKHLDYLKLLMGRSAFYNETMLNGLWRKDARDLFSQLRLLNPDTGGPDNAGFPVEVYIAQMTSLLQTYTQKILQFETDEQDKRQALTDLIEARGKGIISSAARRVFSERKPVETMSDLRRPIRDISKNIDDCRDFVQRARGGAAPELPPTPPFELFDVPNRLI